jgi:hypothetical protein
MRKSTSKLRFNKSTIRVLQGSELTRVVGGAPTAECTEAGPTCSQGSESCPPPSEGCILSYPC